MRTLNETGARPSRTRSRLNITYLQDVSPIEIYSSCTLLYDGAPSMSEFPEKKVLKDLLIKLKSHTIASEEELRRDEERFMKRFEEAHGKLRALAKKCETAPSLKDAVDSFSEVILRIDLLAEDFAKSVHRNEENVKFYIETLEEYSTELDGTLTGIFESAKKQAEEQIREQEELRKRASPESYTA